MSTSFDVVVVGTGPAGCVAAIACCRRGLRTLLLGAKPLESDLPGESLHPGLEPLFQTLGIDEEVNQAGFLRYPGRTVYAGSLAFSEPFGSDARGQWMGYQANRLRLNKLLFEKALASGADVSAAGSATRAVVRDGVVEGVVTNAGTCISRFVIDASGGRQWLARHLGISILQVSPRLTAEFGWVKPAKHRESLTVPEFRMQGTTWSWVAPVDTGRHAWVRLDLAGRSVNPKSPMPAMLRGSVPIGRASSRDVSWKIARPCAGPNYFMVGDAAWVLDPACSHGVFKAVTSAMVAAEAIERSLRGKSDACEQQHGYTAWTENWFCADAAALIALYSAETDEVPWLSSASELLRKIAISPSARAVSINRKTV